MAKKSTLNDLESKLADRAAANVQARIKQFKIDIDAALIKLVGHTQRSSESFGQYYYAATGTRVLNEGYAISRAKHDALQLAICDTDDKTNAKKTWPSILWADERVKLRDELLAKMDLMQQLINAPARDTSHDVPSAESEA